MIQIFIFCLSLHTACSQYNPSILEDMRSEPRLDGSFGFLYHTEDGITHAAKAVAGGVVQGRFTYTDPTGLKVNFNYNAGSNFNPKNAPAPAPNQENYPQDGQQNYPQNYQPLTKPPALQQQQYQGNLQPEYKQPSFQQPVYQSQPTVHPYSVGNGNNNYLSS